MKRKSSYKIALGGIVSALSIVLMLITGIIPFGTYAFPCFAGLLLISIIIEIGYPLAISIFVVVSLLSLLLVVDKEACLYYIMFLGFYPILRTLLSRISNRVIRFLVKILIFNVCIILAFYIGLFVFSIPKDSFVLFGVYLPWLFLILGNIFFIFYDICIDKLTYVYMLKIHPIFSTKNY